MFTLQRELTQLRDDGTLSAAVAGPLIGRERREVVSVYGELRFLTWGGVMLIVSGVGVFLAKNLDRIGPVAITALIVLASAACYAYALMRKRAARESLVDDYILLLGALLASAAVGFVEHQFHQRYLLPLVVFHAFTAYYFRSRLVLSVALGALATWLGLERRDEFLWSESAENAGRAFTGAAIVFVWRLIDARYNTQSTFARVFDHFAINLAFFGTFVMMTHSATRDAGCLLAIVFAIACAVYGVRTREKAFVIYAWVYGVIAVDVLVVEHGSNESLAFLFIIFSTVVAIIGLFVTVAQMRRDA